MQTSNQQPSESDGQPEREAHHESEKTGESALYEFSINAEIPEQKIETVSHEEIIIPSESPLSPVYEVQPGVAYPPPPSFYQNMPDPPRQQPISPRTAVAVSEHALPLARTGNPPRPLYQTYPGMTQPGAIPPTKNKSRKNFWIIFSVIATIILIACGLFSWVAYSFTTRVLSPLVQGETESLNVVTTYYDDIESQQYSAAYSYIQGNGMTESAFTQQATQRDNQFGIVTSFQIGTPSLIETAGSSAYTVPVMVTRNPNYSYTAHLDLHKIGSNWKITYLDLI